MMRPRRRFGQHFLEPAWVRKVVDAIAPEPGQSFLEIGPGPGALTMALAAGGVSIVAVEIDRDLAAALARSAPPNVKVVAADFLAVDVHSLLRRPRDGPSPPDPSGPREGGSGVLQPGATLSREGGSSDPPRTRVVGNLPYNVASPIVFKLLALQREHGLFNDATLMLQHEVAVRVTARPGTKDYGILSILVQAVADVRFVLALPPGAFRPMPKVHSAVVRLEFGPPRVAIAEPAIFEAMVRTLFTQRRKTVLNALRPFAGARSMDARDALREAAIDDRRRPETLQLAELARLAAVFGSGA